MIAIAVDNNPADLKMLCEAIRAVHPGAEVVYFIDPMLAFKYSVSHPVDALYTAVLMKRIGGFKLEKMIRADHSALIVRYIQAEIHSEYGKQLYGQACDAGEAAKIRSRGMVILSHIGILLLLYQFFGNCGSRFNKRTGVAPK